MQNTNGRFEWHNYTLALLLDWMEQAEQSESEMWLKATTQPKFYDTIQK